MRMTVIYLSNIDFACTIWCKRAIRIMQKSSGTKKLHKHVGRNWPIEAVIIDNRAGFFERFSALQTFTAVHPI